MNGTIDQDKLFNFLWSIDEALERCQIPYVVLGQTAFDLKHNLPLTTTRVMLGVLERYNVRELTSMIPIVMPTAERTTDGWIVHENGYSISIKFLTKKYPTLLDPDLCVYKHWRFMIPNPFEEYWALANKYDL